MHLMNSYREKKNGSTRYRSAYLPVNSQMLCRVSYGTIICCVYNKNIVLTEPCFDQGTFWL